MSDQPTPDPTIDLDLPDPPDHEHQDDGTGQAAPGLPLVVARGTSSGWGPGWPNCSPELMARAAGGGVAVNVRRELVELVAGLLAQTVALYTLHQEQTGAYVCRNIAGTNSPSNHSRGTAVDLNWQENQFADHPSFTITPAVVNLWKEYGWTWGGDWSGKKDTMHMEFLGSPAEAARQTARFRAVYVHQAPPTPPLPPPPAPDAVRPRFDPPLALQRIVDAQPAPEGGAILLGEDGSTYAFNGAGWFRGPNGQAWWGGRRAARLDYVGDPANPLAERRWRITASTGETYNLPDGHLS